MKVCDIAKPSFLRVSPTTPLTAALHLFEATDTDSLPVLDHGRLVGMLYPHANETCMSDGSMPTDKEARLVGEVMAMETLFCYDDLLPEEAHQIMDSNQVDQLLVLRRDYQIVGMLRRDDLENAIRETPSRVF